MYLKKKYAALTACSDPLDRSKEVQIEELKQRLSKMGISTVSDDTLYGMEKGVAAGRKKAECLMNYYEDPKIGAIFDVSGGNLSNELLSWLDFEKIRENPKPLFGYSDLTVLLNAIYQKTGQENVLYQIRNLIRKDGEEQRRNFENTMLGEKRDLLEFPVEFWQGSSMEGILVGGNVRCLLKLAGTEYFPKVDGRILFLESLGGGEPLIRSYLAQLLQMGVFGKITGLLLGTFTELEREKGAQAVKELLRDFPFPADLPVAKTWSVGHGADSKALIIGGKVRLK